MATTLRKRTKKAAPASITGLVNSGATKNKLTQLPALPSIPTHLRGKMLTAQMVIPKAGSKWHSDLFIKVGDLVYHLGDCRIAAPLSLYSMKGSSSEAERSAYAKLAGITIAEIEAVAKKERDAAKSRNEARALDSLKAQAEAKGYSLVKKRAAKTAKA